MPLYEFQCEHCKHRFERIQKYTDPVPDTCPSCGRGPIAKLPASPAIQFKGSGWYITDYAKKSSSDAGKSDSGKTSSEKSDSSTGAKGDSGSAAKSDAGKTSGDSSSSSSSTTKPD